MEMLTYIRRRRDQTEDVEIDSSAEDPRDELRPGGL